VQTAGLDYCLALGAALKDAIVRLPGGRVAILGSGGMSHEFWPLGSIREHFAYDASHVISSEARGFDLGILERWERGDHAGVVERYPEYLAKYHPEGRFAHYLIALGALGGRACRARGTRLSSYENAVGTGQVHVFFENTP
jgi:aromatic ring-opening dioxygenase catalytic subunit (LigB family)